MPTGPVVCIVPFTDEEEVSGLHFVVVVVVVAVVVILQDWPCS